MNKLKSGRQKGYKMLEETKRKISLAQKGKKYSKEINKKKGRKQFGKLNHNWKGGKAKHSDGYILIKKEDHPFSNKRGYIYEHRLVMEKHLGRFLIPEEVVHHNNRIPDDKSLSYPRIFMFIIFVSSDSIHIP